MGAVAEFRSLASEMLARAQLAAYAGKTFGGKRNLYEALGYKTDLTVSDYRLRYERGDIAGRVIEVKPESTWRGVGEIIEVEETTTQTAFEKEWETLNKRLDLWSTFFHADVLAGVGRYSIILLGAPGKLDTELKTLPAKDFAYTMSFAEDEATIDERDLVNDSESPRFGMPNFYTLTRVKNSAGGPTKVHHTRCIHIRAEGIPDGVLYGPPRLKRVWNRLDDYEKITGGGSEAFWLRAHQGVVFNLDKKAQIKEPEKTKMGEQLDEWEHGYRRALRLQGVDAKMLGSDVADFSNPVDKLLTIISAASGIPQRLLMGSERGELASTQDRENWSDRIDDRRTQYAHPLIVKPSVQRLIDLKTLPTPKEFSTRWPEQASFTTTEKATLTVALTKANQQQGEDIVSTDEIRADIWGKDPLPADAKDRKPPPAPPEPDAVPPEPQAGVVR